MNEAIAKIEIVEQLYPSFITWCKDSKEHLTVDGIHLIRLWYEFLGTIQSK